MSKTIYTKNNRCISCGSHNHMPHHSVVGSPVDFYLWVNKGEGGSWSLWIKGRADLHQKLTALHDGRREDEFRALVDKLALEFKDGPR